MVAASVMLLVSSVVTGGLALQSQTGRPSVQSAVPQNPSRSHSCTSSGAKPSPKHEITLLRSCRPRQSPVSAAFDGYVEALCQRFYAGALNLGSLMRRYSVGTPRGLQDRAAASLATLWSLLWHPETTATIIGTRFWLSAAPTDLDARHEPRGVGLLLVKAFTTGC